MNVFCRFFLSGRDAGVVAGCHQRPALRDFVYRAGGQMGRHPSSFRICPGQGDRHGRTEVQRNRRTIGIEACGRHDIGNELVNCFINFLLALAFEEAAGNANGHGQQGNQRQQGRVGQCRRAHRTTIVGKTFPHEHPKVRKPFQPVEFIFHAGAVASQNFDQTGEWPFCHDNLHANGSRTASQPAANPPS